jgi:spore maturation protein CgeB
MRVLFCGLKYEYGKKEWGLSFEYQNFYQVLLAMEGVEASLFALDEEIHTYGRDTANERLIQRVQEEKPDLLFCFLFTEELKKETISFITTKTQTKTFNWFADDHWRFPVYSKFWAPLFTAVGTTDSQAMAKYHNAGIKNVIKTQWAANPWVYMPQDTSLNTHNYKISFVGKNYGIRQKYIDTLTAQELPAAGYGVGWPSGAVTLQEMLGIFSFSEINLNFTESYGGALGNIPKELAKLFFKKEGGKFKLDAHHLVHNTQSLWGKRRPQIKGRVFEVLACRGFLLTGMADNLQDYYIPGKEIAVFNTSAELIEKSRYYIHHPEERNRIAQAGFRRTLAEHTYELRFKKIFEAVI